MIDDIHDIANLLSLLKLSILRLYASRAYLSNFFFSIHFIAVTINTQPIALYTRRSNLGLVDVKSKESR